MIQKNNKALGKKGFSKSRKERKGKFNDYHALYCTRWTDKVKVSSQSAKLTGENQLAANANDIMPYLIEDKNNEITEDELAMSSRSITRRVMPGSQLMAMSTTFQSSLNFTLVRFLLACLFCSRTV